MKLTVKQIVEIKNTLEVIKGENTLLFSFAWLLDDNIKALFEHATRAQDELNKLLLKYGKQDKKNPTQYTIEPENVEAYNKDANAIYAFEVDVKLYPIKLEDIQEIKVTAGLDISCLRVIIKNPT